jgi:RHS repeat-associated protein
MVTRSISWLNTFVSVMAAIIILLTPILSYADEEDIPDPGMYKNLVAVENTSNGSIIDTIPIEVPPGRKGVEPKLSLLYNSFNKNGWLGAGWDLNIGSIQRSTRRDLTFPNDEWIATFPGSSDVLIYQSNSSGIYYYKAKVESAFTKYQYISASYSWIATTKDGTQYYFGSTSASRLSTSTSNFMWCLDKVVDTNGNYMTISYTKDNGQIYPYQMLYTGNSGLSTTRYIQFGLEARNDPQISYKMKTAVKTNYRLKIISCYADGGVLAKQYVLTYGYNPINGISRLTQVQVKGSGAETSIQPIILSYYDGGNTTLGYSQTTQIIKPEDVNRKVVWGDINGDSKTDFVVFYGCQNTGETDYHAYATPYISNGDGTFDRLPILDLGIIKMWRTQTFNLADVTGDGRADIEVFNQIDNTLNAYLYTYKFNGSGFTLLSNKMYCSYTSSVMFVDINGDGATDILMNEALVTCNNGWCTRNYTPAISNGDGTFSTGGASFSVENGDLFLADVTGDGYADLISFYGYNGVKRLHIYKSNGTNGYSYLCSTTVDDQDVAIHFADINGDGIADYIPNRYSGTTMALHTRLGKGDGYFQDEMSQPFNTFYSIEQAGDINGDGFADLLLNGGGISGEAAFVMLSKGNGTFYNPVQVNFINHIKVYDYSLLDLNGDGMSDIAISGSTQSCICVHLSQYDMGGGPADHLKSITNEYGGTKTFTYGNSSDYPNNDCPFVVHPVTSAKTNDANGTTSTTTFSYAGAKYDNELREFWGFNPVTQNNPDGTIMTTNYWQDEDLKGKPYQILFQKPDGTYLKKTNLTWGTNSSNNFIYLDLKKTNQCSDGQTLSQCNSSPAAYSQEDYTYDNTNGNLTKVISSGTGAENITKDYVYGNQASGGWVWRLTSETITGSQTGMRRHTTYAYYPTTGNLYSTTYDNDSGSDSIVYVNSYSYGNPTLVTDARGKPTSTGYDATFTYPTTITYPPTNGVSHVESMTWDNRWGKKLTIKDQNGQATGLITQFTYDGYGRPYTISYPDGGEVVYTYYDTSSPRYVRKRVKEGVSGSVTYGYSYDYYDGFGRIIQNTSNGESSYIVSKTHYDEMGRNYRTEGPFFASSLGIITSPSSTPFTETAFDYLGRPLTVTSPGENGDIIASYSYSGLSTTITDPDEKIKKETKDYLGRTVEVEEDDGAYVTQYTYDAAGDLTDVEDDSGNITHMTYDTLGRKKTMTDPDMGYWQYTSYDGNGNLLTQTDANGTHTTFTYDELNRIKTKSYSLGSGVAATPTVNYYYDSATNGKPYLYQIANGNVTTTNNSYDAMGRVKSTTKTISGDSARTTTYTYDCSGKLLTTTYPDGFASTNTYYEGSNLLETVYSGSTTYATISNYKPTGKMGTIVYPNGTTTTYTYDPESTRLTGLLTTGPGGNLQNRSYTYYDSGDIHTIADGTIIVTPSIAYTYTYDNLHRLDTETNTGSYGALNMGYDNLGNITSKQVGSSDLSYYYNTTHKHAVGYINSTSYSFTYDSNGNMKTGWDFTNLSSPIARSMTWNADNMPYQITYNGSTTTFTYDGTGARAKKVGMTTTYYIGDHYEIKDGVATKYIFAGNLRVAQISGTTVSYFHKDHLGSSTVTTRADGTVVESANYEPFGNMRAHSGTTTSDYKFTDQELDGENGLYNYNARLYDPIIGRFITPDTKMTDPYDPQSLNRYAYARNNPLIKIDPTGNYWEETDNGFIQLVGPPDPQNVFDPYLDKVWDDISNNSPCDEGSFILKITKEPGQPPWPIGREPTPKEKDDLESVFPGLKDINFRVTGEQTDKYNCIAFTLGIKEFPVNPESTVKDMNEGYSRLGFTATTEDKARIALFVLNGEPKHGAVKFYDNLYESKLGSYVQIIHPLRSIEGQQYGYVEKFYAK